MNATTAQPTPPAAGDRSRSDGPGNGAMDRRKFGMFIVASGMVLPLGALAQHAGRVFRLGILRPTPPFPPDRITDGIPRALAELGYVEGRNVIIERRYADGRIAELPRLARDLVALRMDVIVAVGTAAVQSVKDATTSIPIVLFGNLDPVATKLVASLARPGGNVTGILIAPEGTLAVKKLELLKEAVPGTRRMALLAPDDAGFQQQLQEARRAAADLGVELVVVEVRGGDFERAFAAVVAVRPGALLVGATTHFVVARRQIIDLAAKHRLPAMYEWPEQVEDGGLMSYGGSLTQSYRRVAAYVDQIFKGTVPADMPIEQPTKFRLVINLKTARSMGLAIPQPVLLRADEVIQ
jgi:putative ABC transport system substrate-binding protein